MHEREGRSWRPPGNGLLCVPRRIRCRVERTRFSPRRYRLARVEGLLTDGRASAAEASPSRSKGPGVVCFVRSPFPVRPFPVLPFRLCVGRPPLFATELANGVPDVAATVSPDSTGDVAQPRAKNGRSPNVKKKKKLSRNAAPWFCFRRAAPRIRVLAPVAGGAWYDGCYCCLHPREGPSLLLPKIGSFRTG